MLTIKWGPFTLCYLLFSAGHRVSQSPHWPQTDYVVKDELEFLIHLPPLPETVDHKCITTPSSTIVCGRAIKIRHSNKLGQHRSNLEMTPCSVFLSFRKKKKNDS